MKTNIPRAAIHVGKDKKTFSAQVSNEAERRGWDEKRYQLKNAELDKNNHYNFSRNKLNFEVTKGGKIVPLGSNPVPLHKRLQQRFDELGFKPYMDANHPDQISRNSPNCTVGIIFSGDHEVFNRLAFGDQQIDTSDPSADHSHIKLQKPIYDWALDTYRFACRKWGEENVIGFCVHCDETSIHAHVQTIPVWQVKKRGRVGNLYISNENPDVKLSTKEWKALPKEERANYTKTTASKETVERVSYAKVWGETKEEKPKYLSDLHTDYHKEVGQKYGLERGIPYNELSAEEKRARRHKDKVTLEAERQAKEAVAAALKERQTLSQLNEELREEKDEIVRETKQAKADKMNAEKQLDNVKKFSVLATIDKKEITIPLLNIKKPVNEAMNGVSRELSIPIPAVLGQKAWREERIANLNDIIRTLVSEINAERDRQNDKVRDSVNKTYTYYMQKLSNLIEENKAVYAENKALKEENTKVKQRISELDEHAVERVTASKDAVIRSLESELSHQKSEKTSLENENSELRTKYNNLADRWNGLWENPEIKDAWNMVVKRKEREKQEAEYNSRRQKERYDDIHDRLIKEAANKIRAFNSTSRIEFSEDERISIYFGIIAHCLKAKLDPTMESDRTEAVEGIYSNFNLNDSSFRSKCCKNWTKMFASQITVDAETVNSFKATINAMCLSDHYVSLMGSNGAAHTLTHWDGSQVQGLGAQDKKKGMSR